MSLNYQCLIHGVSRAVGIDQEYARRFQNAIPSDNPEAYFANNTVSSAWMVKCRK